MTTTPFQPDYRHLLAAARNERPARLPFYEHIISPRIMEQVLDERFADLLDGNPDDVEEFFRHYCRFFREMTYDTVSFEVCAADVLPDHGAILGGRPGPIQSRADFERYPWAQLPGLFWEVAEPQFTGLARSLPAGMKAIGGIGNGVFEISEDLVGLEYLAYMQIDDAQLFADLYLRIGDLLATLWERCLERYGCLFAVARFGDDLGFKTNTLIAPDTIGEHIIPQYRRIIARIHQAKLPFLWHSCGNIFSIMDEVLAVGIDAKHSNEDAIAPFDTWIERYGERIGLFGGIDVDLLCQETPAVIRQRVIEQASRFRRHARGYALGSGNSIPDYVPVEGYLAMIEAGRQVRQDCNLPKAD